METVKVAIVGGGIAGLSAARTLIQNGLTNVVVLEACDRLGGRIWTRKYGDSHIEMGAQWIHGEGNNPVYQIAHQEHNVCKLNPDSASVVENRKQYFYMQDGKQIPSTIVDDTFQVIDEILSCADKFYRENIPLTSGDDCIGSFARVAFNDYLRSSVSSTDEIIAKETLFDWKMVREKTENGCDSFDELSLFAWGQYLEYEGDASVVLKNGYQPILNSLSRNIPHENIRLNCQVQKIKWISGDDMIVCPQNGEILQVHHSDMCKVPSIGPMDASNVEETSNSGSNKSLTIIQLTSGETIEADFVIYTGSLGVLKSTSQNLFEPQLPDEKKSVIERMGFGTVNKIYLEFPQPFWDKDCEAIQLVWVPNADPVFLGCLDNKHIEEFGHWYHAIHGFTVVDHHSNLLCGWIAGEEARIMEKLDDSIVLDVCIELLKKFTGQKSIPEPTNILRTYWHSNPLVCGSYSYVKAGHTTDDCDILAQPLPSVKIPRLLFAGEATHRSAFSTTHGALLSGEREAQRIITHIQSPQCQARL